MTTSSLFKWRHFAPEIIVCGVPMVSPVCLELP